MVTQRHNEVKDALGDQVALGYKEVVWESVICDGNDVSSTLIADLGVWGVWTPQAEALFDVRVTDADAASYADHSVALVLHNAEEEKKRKYLSAASCLHTFSIPILPFLNYQFFNYLVSLVF